jgi:hypothetical protein
MDQEGQAAATEKVAAASGDQVRVLSCVQCQGPVASSAGGCPACGAALTGKEFPYIIQRSSAPDIPGLIKWWAILSLGIWALAGFSFGIGSSLLFTVVSLVYLVRILRAYYR